MTRTEMLDELRIVIDDNSQRPRWTNRYLLGLLAEGQDKFCEDTGFFKDKTTYQLETIVDQPIYDISDRIIEVLAVWYGTKRLGHYQEYQKTWPHQENRSVLFHPDSTYPYYWQADEETGILSVFPTPQEVVTFDLHVWRYSLFSLDDEDIDGNDTPATPELPKRFQRACIEWAAHKAYNDHDAEKGDNIGSDKHLKNYNMYVSDGMKAARRFHAERNIVTGNPLYNFR